MGDDTAKANRFGILPAVDVTSEVVSQGIVNFDILAGFALVIAADIPVKEPAPENLKTLRSSDRSVRGSDH